VRGVLAVLAALALYSVACTLKPLDSSDGGADAGSTSSLGGQCTRIETAYCQRAMDCLVYSGTLTQCVNDAELKCCADKCGNPSPTSDGDVATCVQAIGQLDCNSVATGASPAVCANVPKVQ